MNKEKSLPAKVIMQVSTYDAYNHPEVFAVLNNPDLPEPLRKTLPTLWQACLLETDGDEVKALYKLQDHISKELGAPIKTLH